MEWLILLAVVVYLGLAVVSDGFDALLAWIAHDPKTVVKAAGAALGTGLISAVFKEHVTATIYVSGVLGGLTMFVFDWLKSMGRHR